MTKKFIYTFFSSPMVWLYAVTFLVILPVISKDLVYSVYRSSSLTRDLLQKKLLLDNAIAVKASEHYLSTMTPGISHFPSTAKLVIVVITVRRFNGAEPVGYLTRVVTSLHRLLSEDHVSLQDRFLLICDAHAGPGMHEEADNLRRHFYSVKRFPNGSAEASIMNPFEKEKQDYIFCLQQALNFLPEFVLVVEDDALPRNDLFPVMRHLMKRLQDPDHHVKRTEVLSYVKLYYPERWQGYSFELQKMCELLGLFAFGATVFAAGQLYLSRQRRLRSWTTENWKTPFLGGLYLVIVAIAVGRQHLLELKRVFPSSYSMVSAPECCSPSILYPSKSAGHIVLYLETVTCSHSMPLDIALDTYTSTRSLTAYLVVPNVFRHIGFISTMKGLSNYPEEFLI